MKYLLCSVVWVITLLSGAGLFWTSNEVQEAESAMVMLQDDMARYQERIAILNTEWHYLNNPAYLEKLTAMAFDPEQDFDTVVLAGGADLPAFQTAILPVPKPTVPESYHKTAPVLVAAVEKGHSSKSDFVVAETAAPSQQRTQQKFGMMLASWTQ